MYNYLLHLCYDGDCLFIHKSWILYQKLLSAVDNTHDCYVLTEEDLNGEKSKTEVCESSPYRESVCENCNVQEGCETCEHCCQTKGTNAYKGSDCFFFAAAESTLSVVKRN